MQYKYVKEQQNYSDLASGRVFHSLPGHPAFPVRLVSEIFQRCMASRVSIYKNSTRCVLYDPCCGAGYQLSVLATLHRESIHEVIGSDIDEKAVALAKRNLELINVAGLDRRIDEISEMSRLYGKPSHQDALRSAQILKSRAFVLSQQYPVRIGVFRANATDGREILSHLQARSVDIVITDIPYGLHSSWRDSESVRPAWSLLEALTETLSNSSVLAVSSNKQQKVSHENYRRIDQFQAGKRRITILVHT